jgi:hypothetical protein
MGEGEIPRERVGPSDPNVPAAVFGDDRLEPNPEIGAAGEALRLQELGVPADRPKQSVYPRLDPITWLRARNDQFERHN